MLLQYFGKIYNTLARTLATRNFFVGNYLSDIHPGEILPTKFTTPIISSLEMTIYDIPLLNTG